MSKVVSSNSDEKDEVQLLLGSNTVKVASLRGIWRRDCCPFLPARYALAVMGFMGFFNVYALRANLSMAIVQMANDSSSESQYRTHPYKARESDDREDILSMLVVVSLFKI